MGFNLSITGVTKPKKFTFDQSIDSGENKAALPERILADQAVTIVNYDLIGDGIARLREGLKLLIEITEPSKTLTPSMLRPISTTHLAFAYHNDTDTKIGVYDIAADTQEIKHTISGNLNPVGGVSYDDFFYFGNGAENIRVIHKDGIFVNYDGGTGDFTVGEVCTSSSGGTGTIVSINGSTSDGTLVLTGQSGTFNNNDTLTDPITGVANQDGEEFLSLEITDSDAPKAKKFEIMKFSNGNYLLAGNTGAGGQVAEVIWSKKDTDATDIPFLGWGASDPTAPILSEGSSVLFRRGGALNKIVFHEGRVYTYYNRAISIFHQEAKNVDTVGLIQVTVSDDQEFGVGGISAVSTPDGVFHTNSQGLWRITFSENTKIEDNVTLILGRDEINKLDFTNSEVIFDGDNKVTVFCGRNSVKNNFAFQYYLDTGAIVDIEGMAIADSSEIDGKLFGVDTDSMKIYELFNGPTDNGLKIDFQIDYRHETGDNPVMLKKAFDFWIEGSLSMSSKINIWIDRYDKKNRLDEGAKKLIWTGSQESSFLYGVGKSAVGKPDTTVQGSRGNDFAHKKVRLNNAKKIQVRIFGSDEVGHEIHWWGLRFKDKKVARPNNLTLQ